MDASIAVGWEIRRASLADRPGLEALCRAAVGDDDYVLEILEELILDGVFNVALDGSRIVGAMHYRDAIDGSGWLAAARTHPDYRRRGVARALLENCAGLAQRSRAHALRLLSSTSNAAGNASAKAGGFTEVAKFSRLEVPAARWPTPRVEQIAFTPDLSAEVHGSRVLALAKGYVPYGWSFVDLTPANVHLLANREAFLRIGKGIVCTPDEPGEEPLGFGLVAGDPGRVLAEIPALAARSGKDRAVGFLPFEAGVLAAAKKAGFMHGSWGQQVVLYERRIPVGPLAYRRRPTYAEIAAGKREGYAALALLAGKHGHGHTGPHEDRWNP